MEKYHNQLQLPWTPLFVNPSVKGKNKSIGIGSQKRKLGNLSGSQNILKGKQTTKISIGSQAVKQRNVQIQIKNNSNQNLHRDQGSLLKKPKTSILKTQTSLDVPNQTHRHLCKSPSNVSLNRDQCLFEQ